MGKELDKQNVSNTSRKKRTFKNFADYWHHVKSLSEEQRKSIVEGLSKSEQNFLQTSYKKGGWEDLLRRNQCDKILDIIKDKFKVDVLLIRSKVLSGKPQLIQKAFWEYVKSSFEELRYQHISYIFDGIVEENAKDGYVLLKAFVPMETEEEIEEPDFE